ncbi:MAG: Flp pilus assembly protein TadG [Mariniblastus sp.]|jgi:Flp pilus assembly protein TadG
MKNRHKKRHSFRGGAAAVEAALMLPLLVLTTFGSIDVAQYINTGQVVSNASRVGARVAIRNQTTSEESVRSAVVAYLKETYPRMDESALTEALSITVRQHGVQESDSAALNSLSSVESGSTLNVLVEFEFESIRWLPGPRLFNKLSNNNYCRRE